MRGLHLHVCLKHGGFSRNPGQLHDLHRIIHATAKVCIFPVHTMLKPFTLRRVYRQCNVEEGVVHKANRG